ncbi:MAG: Fic family protein [Deltaproteobacteria bacterium]|nr:Fic family protein [Deltaproteobacteria bacterium]
MSLLGKINQNQEKINEKRPFEYPLLDKVKEFYRTGIVWSSNALDGFEYDPIETNSLLNEGITAGGKRLVDALAVVGMAKAYDFMYKLLPYQIVLESNILSFHSFLKGSLLNDARAGSYRDNNVCLTRTRALVPSPKVFPFLLTEFYEFLGSKPKDFHAIEFAALAQVKFLLINPFSDGNERIARLITNTILIQHNYLPIIINPSIKADYQATLEQAYLDKTNSFIELIAEMVYSSQFDFLRLVDSGFENQENNHLNIEY